MRRIGPFLAANSSFEIVSGHDALLDLLDHTLVDLRHPATPSGHVTEFRVDHNGPSWMTHPWAVWRDGEPCETSVVPGYIVAYLVWEITRLVLEDSDSALIPIHAAAVRRDGRAIVLAGASHAGKSTLAAWLTHRGWDFLTDEIALVDSSSTPAMVHPFPRPIGVRRGGPLDPLLGRRRPTPHELDEGEETLLAASSLGSIGSAAPLAAVVCTSYRPGEPDDLKPLADAAALVTLSEQLPSLGRDGALVFNSAAALCASHPTYALTVDDLDRAVDRLETLLSAPAGTAP